MQLDLSARMRETHEERIRVAERWGFWKGIMVSLTVVGWIMSIALVIVVALKV